MLTSHDACLEPARGRRPRHGPVGLEHQHHLMRDTSDRVHWFLVAAEPTRTGQHFTITAYMETKLLFITLYYFLLYIKWSISYVYMYIDESSRSMLSRTFKV